MTVQTVFMVDGQTYSIEGAGQSAVAAALDKFKNMVVKLHGFIIDGVFKPIDLK